jgi:glycosyltransferase involved in cell wall biosynthesis
LHLVSLLPTLEGLIVPSKLYGILAAGRPLIFIGDVDGDIGRVIRRAQCGRSVTVGDSKGLADSLRNLAADPDVRALMGARARTLLCQEFGLQQAIDRWIALIDSARLWQV